MLKISEIFYSIQGEGRQIGRPSVFVRVGMCNLTCKGFSESVQYEGKKIIGCDSIYAANKAFSKEWIVFEDSKKLISEIEQKGNGNFDIVLTGGEPSLYFGNKVLLETLKYFIKRHHHIYVESNGSVFFDFNEILKSLHFTLGVKLSNTLDLKEKRINIKAMQNILDHAKSVYFKFVLNQEMCKDGSGIAEINEILAQVSGSYEVYLMPQGSDIETLDRNIKFLLPLCLENNFYLSDRLHIRIWGNKRGV